MSKMCISSIHYYGCTKNGVTGTWKDEKDIQSRCRVFRYDEMTHHYVDDILYPFLEIVEMREITQKGIHVTFCFYLKTQFDIQIVILCTW